MAVAFATAGDTPWDAELAEAVAAPVVAAMKDTASPTELVRAHHRAGFIFASFVHTW
jgi:hypothetical protein